MAKHSKENKPRVIRLDDYRERPSFQEPEVEYEDISSGEQENLDFWGDAAPSSQDKKRRELRRLPKAVYVVSLVLVAVVLGLSLWVNREYLTWDNIRETVRLQVMGEESGDGYPVEIVGANVYEGNFLSYNGSAVMLSNTALTSVGGTGKQEFSLRHNLSQPVLKAAGGRYLIYNSGSTGYIALSGGQTVAEGTAEGDIIAGGICPEGKFALGMESSFGASRLEVYMKDGSLQYEYPFANDYITAMALNYDGTYGAVCTVRSEKGEMVSRLTIFDFGETEPLTQIETRNNLLVDVAWAENGSIYAVGDTALVLGRSSDYQFTEYDYQGRQLTAYSLSSGRAFLSISAYEHAGASTLLAFQAGEPLGEQNPMRVEVSDRIRSISTYGSTAGLLAGSQVICVDYVNGMELGRAEAGDDAKGIGMASERKAYILGVSEIREAQVE